MTPSSLRQGTLSGVFNPYRISRNSATSNTASNRASAAAITTTTTSIVTNSEGTNNIATTEEDSNMGESSTYNYVHMKGNTTNGGYRNAIRLYNLYKDQNRDLACQYPSLDDLRPPNSIDDHAEYKEIIQGFADYLVTDARQKGTDKRYDAGSGKTIFFNLIGYLKSLPLWASYKEPDWYKGTAANIKARLLNIQAQKGDLKKLKQESRVGRKVFKEMLDEIFKQCPANKQAQTWSEWYIYVKYFVIV